MNFLTSEEAKLAAASTEVHLLRPWMLWKHKGKLGLAELKNVRCIQISGSYLPKFLGKQFLHLQLAVCDALFVAVLKKRIQRAPIGFNPVGPTVLTKNFLSFKLPACWVKRANGTLDVAKFKNLPQTVRFCLVEGLVEIPRRSMDDGREYSVLITTAVHDWD